MAGEERALSAEDLTARWLTAEEVLGRHPGLRADNHRGPEVVSAGEYQQSALRLVAEADAAPVGGHPAPDLVAADTAQASRWFTADPAPGRLAGRTVVLPFVALAELATWPERLLWGHARSEDLSRWTDPGRVIAADDTVCRVWARITVAAQRAGSAASSEDAWIAAGCLSYGLPLATQHKRRYQYFAARYGLRLL
ncbi:putative nucleic acid-binding protein [Catenulispora sp. MAP5-51]